MSGGFIYLPPTNSSSTFNSNNFSDPSGLSITLETANLLFCKNTDMRLSYLVGITPGIAASSSALVLDSSRNITNINSLTASTLTGTLQTAAQTNITSIGTLTQLLVQTASGTYGMNHTNGSTTMGSYIQDNTNCWFGTQVANSSNMGLFVSGNLNKSLILNGTSGYCGIATLLPNKALSVNNSTGDCLRLIYNDATGTDTNKVDFNVSSGGNLTIAPSGGTLSLTGTISATSLTGTLTTAAQPNITSIGTLATITATSINGTLQTAAQPNITSIGTLASLVATAASISSTLRVMGSSVPVSSSGVEISYTAPGVGNILAVDRGVGGFFKQLNLNNRFQITFGNSLILGDSSETTSSAWIDLKSNANNYSMNFHGGLNTIGSDGNSMIYSSNSTGHLWYQNSTPFTLGTLNMYLSSVGLFVQQNAGVNANLSIGTSQTVSTLNVNATSSHVYLTYGDSATIYNTISCGADGEHIMTAYSGGTFSTMTYTKAGFMSLAPSTLSPRYCLDMGNQSARNIDICQYQSGSSGTIGLGHSTTDMYLSAINDFKFYQSASNGAQTNLVCTIDDLGILSPANVRISGSSAPVSGSSLELSYNAGSAIGEVFVYNRSTFAYGDLYLNGVIRISPAGKTSIGTLLDLGVVFGVNSTTSTQYVNTLWTIFSDKRLKKNIVNADLQICYDNIKKVPLRKFGWVEPFVDADGVVDNNSIGFIADELEKVAPKSVHISYANGIVDCKSVNLSSHLMSLFGASQLMMQKIEDLQTTCNNQQQTIDKLIGILTPAALNKFNSL
jgi:hypothetical protein